MRSIIILAFALLTYQTTAVEITDFNDGTYFYCQADLASPKSSDQLTFGMKDAGFKQLNAYQCRSVCGCDRNMVITCGKYSAIPKDRVYDACVNHGAPGYWGCGCKVIEGQALVSG